MTCRYNMACSANQKCPVLEKKLLLVTATELYKSHAIADWPHSYFKSNECSSAWANSVNTVNLSNTMSGKI